MVRESEGSGPEAMGMGKEQAVARGRLQAEYDRDLPEEFLQEVEALVGQVPTLKDSVYHITDLGPEDTLYGKKIDRNELIADIPHGLKRKNPDLNNEEVSALVDVYTKKLENLLDRAIKFNS